MREDETARNISLLLSALAALLSLGGVAYSAGSVSTRVEGVERDVGKLSGVNERLARIEADLGYLRNAEERRQRGEGK